MKKRNSKLTISQDSIEPDHSNSEDVDPVYSLLKKAAANRPKGCQQCSKGGSGSRRDADNDSMTQTCANCDPALAAQARPTSSYLSTNSSVTMSGRVSPNPGSGSNGDPTRSMSATSPKHNSRGGGGGGAGFK